MIQRSIQEEDITFANICEPKIGPKYINKYQQYINRRGLSHPTYINRQIIQSENQ